MDNNAIQIVQLPIIREQLQPLKEKIDKEVSDALSLVCTEETIQTVKTTRANLNKMLTELEEQRKAVKAQIMAPYNEFEAVYKECVTDTLKAADEALKSKISDIENEQKNRCEESLREYFDELSSANHLEWLTFERSGVKVDLTSAKQKTPTKLRKQLVEFVADVNRAIETIATMDDSTEILVEYKQSLDLPDAISKVMERHQRIQEEAQGQEQRQAIVEQEADSVKKVEALAPPTVVEQEAIYECSFKVRTTMKKIKKIKELLESEEIDYE